MLYYHENWQSQANYQEVQRKVGWKRKKKKSNIKIPFALEINSIKMDLVYSVISHSVLQYDNSVFCFSLCIKKRDN